ncbi:MAG: hypothetical protein WBI07_15480 [Mobilitalea sp.]
MKKLIRYCNWELKNDFATGGYFSAMLIMYCIIDLILGIKNVDILLIFEMFIINYLLSIVHRFVLDDKKEYSTKNFLLRASGLCVGSVLAVAAIGKIGGWFEGMPLWAEISIYAVLVLSYLTVWTILKLAHDTETLNDQLANYKNKSK